MILRWAGALLWPIFISTSSSHHSSLSFRQPRPPAAFAAVYEEFSEAPCSSRHFPHLLACVGVSKSEKQCWPRSKYRSTYRWKWLCPGFRAFVALRLEEAIRLCTVQGVQHLLQRAAQNFSQACFYLSRIDLDHLAQRSYFLPQFSLDGCIGVPVGGLSIASSS